MHSNLSIFVLVYLIINAVKSVESRYGFPPENLHVNLKEERKAVRGPIIFENGGASENHIQNIFRNKRDVVPSFADTSQNKNINIKINVLYDSHAQLMVHWLGDGSGVMICLARDPPSGPLDDPKNIHMQSPSSVYFAYDNGNFFVNRTKLFPTNINGTETNSIDKFLTHPKFDTIIFTDSRNKAIFHVPVRGDDIKRYVVDFTPSVLSFYESDPKTFLVLDKEDPDRNLYYTTDAGASFSLLQTNVKSFSWSSGEGMPTHLYVERKQPTNTSSVIFMNALDLIKPTARKDFHLLVENVQDFHIKKDFMFATRKVVHDTQLWVSYKKGRFVKANFQTELVIKGLHIADVQERRILVSAVHSDITSHLYVSAGNSDMTDIKFVPSLENIFTYIPGITLTSGWLVQTTDEAFTDLYKVEGLKGIYIASTVSRTPESKIRIEGIIGPGHLMSVITFDNGGTWRPITAPKVDDVGNFLNCTNDCSLQFSQKFNRLYPVTRSVTIMSSKSSPGVIIASGVVGKSLKGRPGVFLSRDAGLTWKQILNNYHFFNFGNHGGILVAVKYFKSKGETREILYSTDEGQTWLSQPFRTNELKVYGLMKDPNTTSTFTLFGSEPQEHRWRIIKIDLRNAFSYNCTHDDYKFWAPSSQTGDSLMSCVMGMQQTFQRRFPHRNCFNGQDYDRPVKTEICPCNLSDFECDFGFSRLNRTSPCIRNKMMALFFDPYMIPKNCKEGEFYNRTRGYRKIEDDVCVDGDNHRYLPQSVACPIDKVNHFLVIAQSDQISRIDLLNGKKLVLPIKGLNNVIAIDFDMKHNCVFWADITSGTIGRQCLNGNQTTEILVDTELGSVEGMSFDWISELLFFVDGTRSKIEAVKTSNDAFARMRTTIIDSKHLTKPRGIVVNPIEGYLFWTDWSLNNPSLSRSNLDGSSIMTLFTKPDVVWPNGVTIDYFAQRVYWVDASKDYIGSCDLNGKAFAKILEQDARVAHPFAVAVFKDLMYWDDWKMNSVFSANKDHGIMITTVKPNMTSLMDLKVYAHFLQEGTNACNNNHNCTHICVGAPNGRFTCICPDGLEKVEHECLCSGGMTPYKNNTCPHMPNTCDATYFKCDNKLCIPGPQRCDGENDCGDNSDEFACIWTGPSCPNHMFKCKNSNQCIPGHLACNFDYDCDDKSDEEGCKLSQCKESEFYCTNGRCISAMWMCDGEDDCRDNSDETNCWSKNGSTLVCEPDEFRCNSNGHCIPNTWKCDDDNDCPDGSDEIDCNIKECEMWEFDCGDGRCIHRTWTCDGEKDCVNGADEVNCTTVVPTIGSANSLLPIVRDTWEFFCGNDECIPIQWKCDKINDCSDGTDEYGCSNSDNGTVVSAIKSPDYRSEPRKCLINQFECDSGGCIPKHFVCDGIFDCLKGEDEKYCLTESKVNCGPGKFRCRSDNICLPISKYCDKVTHCADGSDEQDCEKKAQKPDKSDQKVTCNPGYFSCDQVCLALMKLCDDKPDCNDATDEEQCGKGKFRRVYQVNTLSVENRTLNATSFQLSWWVTLSPQANVILEYLPSISLAGVNAWQNHTEWLQDKKHRFMNLKPYNAYNVTVYIRAKGEPAVPPYLYVTITTEEGVSNAPLNVNAIQLNGLRVQVSWDPPKETYGKLVSYTIYYKAQSVPNAPTQSVKVSSQEHSIVLQSYFKGNVTYSFWVRAKTHNTESPFSNMEHLTFDDVSNIDSLKGLTITNYSESSVIIEWQKIKGADGYIVQPFLGSPYPKLPPIKTDKPKVKIDNMVAGVEYTFKVSGFVKNYIGRLEMITFILKGDPLPVLTDISSVYFENEFPRLEWKKPDTNLERITYGVYYGTSEDELLEKPRITTQYLSVRLKDFMPCVSYLISVGIVGPIGPGPLTSPIQLNTLLNDKKPPKNLNAEIVPENTSLMKISWEHNCPITGVYPTYIIKVNEITLNKESIFVFPRSSNKTLSHYISDIPYGAKYNISVASNTPDAEPAFVLVKGPDLDEPRQLKVWPAKNGAYVVYWKEIDKHFDFKYTYELVIFEGMWINRSDDLLIVNKMESKIPPILVNPEHLGGAEAVGKVFTFGVRMKSEQGFVSLISEMEYIKVQQPDVQCVMPDIARPTIYEWLSFVAISVVLILTGVVAYLIKRHKRLRYRFSNNIYRETLLSAKDFGGSTTDNFKNLI